MPGVWLATSLKTPQLLPAAFGFWRGEIRPSETIQTAKKAVGRLLVSDICRSPENLVLRTSVGFENPTYALRRNEAWETLKKIVVCQINKGRLKLFRRPLLIYAQYVYA